MLVNPAPRFIDATSKPLPSSMTANAMSRSSSSRTLDDDVRRLRVLLDVLQRLQHAEVHRGLDVLRVAADPVGFDRYRNRRLSRLRFQRHAQSFVGKQRWIDAARQVAQRLERLVGIGLQLIERLLRTDGVPSEEHLGEPDLHLDGDEMLLGAVMQVALEAAALLVLRGDETLP